MRLFQSLHSVHKGFWYKTLWKKKSKYRVRSMGVPRTIVERGIKPVDPLDEWNATKKKEVWVPPDDPRFMFPSKLKDDPNWQKGQAYTLGTDTKLWEGVKQAQVLTNCVVHNNKLPTTVTNRLADYDSGLDYLMQKDILKAHLWDPTRVKLPVREKPKDISLMNYKTEYGIPDERIVTTMLSSISQRCSQLTSIKDPLIPLSRKVIADHELHTMLNFKRKPIYVKSETKFLLTSSTPITRFASEDEVTQTMHEHVTNMFPIAPTVDLKHSNIYRKNPDAGYSEQFSHVNHHTLLLAYDSTWSMDVRHANAIMMSYAHCVQRANSLQCLSLIESPISIQTIHTDGISFGYTCFQLNTCSTDMVGIKNIAWVDSDHLFDKVIPRRSMLRNTKYQNYAPDVSKKIMALWLS